MSVRSRNSLSNGGDVRSYDGVDVMPGDSCVSFRGSLHMTRSTLTINKDPIHPGETPLFIGNCSIPLIQLFHHKDHITLLRGNTFLFDNAALSAGISGYAPHTAVSAGGIQGSAVVDTPTAWESITMQFESEARAQQVVDALLRRHAQKTSVPPFPVHDATPLLRRAGTPTSSVTSYAEDNGFLRHIKSPQMDSPGHMSRPASERLVRENSQDRPPSVRRAASSHTSSRLPSRRELSVRSSQRLEDSLRSSHLPSRRELDVSSSRSSVIRREAVSAAGTTSSRVVRGGSNARVAPTRRLDNPAEGEYLPMREHLRPQTPDGSRQLTPRDSQLLGDRAAVVFSNAGSPRSTAANSHRAEPDMFLRSVLKLQHHRMHFIQYLHKEMVHQAYLAAEARVKAAAAGGVASVRGRRSTSPGQRGGSSHRHRSRSLAAQESSRLQEIEKRLVDVVALHHEAEREREDAARLRREYEWRNEDLLAKHPHLIQSRELSISSALNTPARQSAGAPAGRRRPNHAVSQRQPFGSRSTSGLMIPYANDGGACPHDAVAPDVGTSIVDRYVFGADWAAIFPAHEADVRFNAQVDVCLAVNMPRHFVLITHLVVDQPGLRVTAEVTHDHNVLSRGAVNHRIQSSPFRFLQRLYEMRDLLRCTANVGAPGAAALSPRRSSSHLSALAQRSLVQRRPSQRHSSSYRQPLRLFTHDDEIVSRYSERDDADADARSRALQQRTDDRVREAADRMARKKDRLIGDVQRQMREITAQLEDDEDYQRESLMLTESKTRQQLHCDAPMHVRDTLLVSTTTGTVEESEAIARATMEVGFLRRMLVLTAAHRRQMQLYDFMQSERGRRRDIADLELLARQDLSNVMNPGTTHDRLLQVLDDEPRRRLRLCQSEEKSRAALVSSVRAFLKSCAADHIHFLIADEKVARAAISSEALTALLQALYSAPSMDGRASRGRLTEFVTRDAAQQLCQEMLQLETEERASMMAEDAHRRQFFKREDVIQSEMVRREGLDLQELDARGAILDAMVFQNRQQLERRINERERLTTVQSEEQFYRKATLADEQDGFEVIAELFAAALKSFLSRLAEELPPEASSPRFRVHSPRTAKPFHYMTFSPEDMDFVPSAVLAIEGILGCAINKNLEVTSISRPLPKVDDEDVQFQAGDMILDVAGHSLHSLSHLREVLSSRTMQVQKEAAEEFPTLPESEYTTNPALQKYIELLCEHHNFLVQVLRGCDIFQIIVKS